MLDQMEARTIRQTLDAPMETLPLVLDHAKALSSLVDWDALGVLYDDTPEAVVVVCLEQDIVVAVVRLCVPIESMPQAIAAYRPALQSLSLRCRQSRTFSKADLVDLAALTAHWANGQGCDATPEEIRDFYQRITDEVRTRGRLVKVTVETSRRVWFESHGRCMFDGCGTDLTRDPITGQRSNFGYEAHNVAASEMGPRGILYLSSLLENDPANILLLCDTHHRLIDGIAKADYPAERVTEMRARFCTDAEALLDGLQRPRIPAFCISWPIHRQVISAPSDLQIAQALTPIGVRVDGQLRRLNDNEKVLRDVEPEQMWPLMPATITQAAADILAQTHTNSYRAALFAMGLMPPLIALGALLGNKNEITPMLRDRDSGLWYWPNEDPGDAFYEVTGIDALATSSHDVTLEFAFTARPEAMKRTTEALGHPVITLMAKSMRNGALAHPVEGYRFRQHMQEILHRLRDEFGVKRVHLLPCASNAACVFFGQAFDSSHPELQIYDFSGQSMTARLLVSNHGNACHVSGIKK